jgi:hypothetical protein
MARRLLLGLYASDHKSQAAVTRDQKGSDTMSSVETLVLEQPVQQSTTSASSADTEPPTQTYSVSFDPTKGTFRLFDEDKKEHPSSWELVVNQPNTNIVINATPPLTFYLGSKNPALRLLPVNDPTLLIDAPNPPTRSAVSFAVPTVPDPSQVFGFYLNMNYDSPALINLTSPSIFITQGSATLSNIALHYDTAQGVFSYGDLHSIEIDKASLLYRLASRGNQNSRVSVTLSSDNPGLIFADPAAILWADGTKTPRDSNDSKMVTIDRPFASGTAISMQFILEYPDGTTIYSPDPIIMDKQIGDNG